jgi:hypothetical protein
MCAAKSKKKFYETVCTIINLIPMISTTQRHIKPPSTFAKKKPINTMGQTHPKDFSPTLIDRAATPTPATGAGGGACAGAGGGAGADASANADATDVATSNVDGDAIPKDEPNPDPKAHEPTMKLTPNEHAKVDAWMGAQYQKMTDANMKHPVSGGQFTYTWTPSATTLSDDTLRVNNVQTKDVLILSHPPTNANEARITLSRHERACLVKWLDTQRQTMRGGDGGGGNGDGSGGELAYMWTPTWIGNVLKIKHTHTQEILDLTNYDEW